jgi:hypothetical protein
LVIPRRELFRARSANYQSLVDASALGHRASWLWKGSGALSSAGNLRGGWRPQKVQASVPIRTRILTNYAANFEPNWVPDLPRPPALVGRLSRAAPDLNPGAVFFACHASGRGEGAPVHAGG